MNPREVALLIAREIAPYVADVPAHELANNFVCGLLNDTAEPSDVATEMIRHRIKHFGLACGDVECCARVMAVAWARCQPAQAA